REWAQLSAAGVAGASVSGWFGTLADHARAASPARPKSCILLWLAGGPSHHDTFDPKPHPPAEIRGQLKGIPTAVPRRPGREKFPRFAKLMKDAAILRGMSTDEPEHGRARIFVHTGYKPGFGGLRYPLMGSMVSAELGRSDAGLPNFVVTGTLAGNDKFLTDARYPAPRPASLVLHKP